MDRLNDKAKIPSPGSSDHCSKRSEAAVAGNPQKTAPMPRTDHNDAYGEYPKARVPMRMRSNQEQPAGGLRPNANENEQISPTTTVPVARRIHSRPHLASVLPS
jgi:hypothetical protein